MVSETFCSNCMRTAYASPGDDCPVCSSPLLEIAGPASDAPAPAPAGKVDPAIVPDDEAERLQAIRRYDILDTPRDGAFDRITSLAARIFNVPIATITIVDTDRIWFKSTTGLEVAEIDRDAGLCASAVLVDEPWVVEDAREDPRTLENPLVRGELGLQFYAGVPLKTLDGHNLGMLNIIDREPRTMDERELAILTDLGQIVIDELELRLAARRLYEGSSLTA